MGKNNIEDKTFERKVKLLAEKIEKMEPSEYDRFIKSMTFSIANKHDKAAGKNVEAARLRKEKRYVTEKEFATIVASHMAVLGLLGAGVGASVKVAGEPILGAVTGFTVGVGTGQITGIINSLLKDNEKAVRLINEMRAKVLEKKAKKLTLKATRKEEILSGVAENGKSGATRGVAREILQGVEDLSRSMDYSKLQDSCEEFSC